MAHLLRSYFISQALAAYLKSLRPIRNQVPSIAGDADKPTAPYFAVVMPN